MVSLMILEVLPVVAAALVLSLRYHKSFVVCLTLEIALKLSSVDTPTEECKLKVNINGGVRIEKVD